MNRSWKRFIITVSVMLGVIIGCTAWNVALDKITGSIGPDISQSNNTDNSSGNVSNNGSAGTVQNRTGTVTNANGQAAQARAVRLRRLQMFSHITKIRLLPIITPVSKAPMHRRG